MAAARPRPGAQRPAHGRRRAKRDAEEAAWIAQQAKRAQEAKEKEAREAKEAKARQEKQRKDAERLAAKQRRDEATAREAAKIKVDPEVGKLAVQLGISTHEAAQILARPDVVPSKRELDECHALGFTQEAIAHSKVMDELGPRMTLSPHGRVLRWCEVLAYRVRCDDKHIGIYFDSDALKPVVDAGLAEFVGELNRLGAARAPRSSRGTRRRTSATSSASTAPSTQNPIFEPKSSNIGAEHGWKFSQIHGTVPA